MARRRSLVWLLELGAAIAIAQAAGLVGSVFTFSAIPGWYATLVLPAGNPPNWVFGPVWGVLYTLMGVAAFLVWRQKDNQPAEARIGLIAFAVQLGLNAVWSVLFFGLHNPAAALLDIVLLWTAILATIAAFGRVTRLAAWLLVPYLLWVTYAVYLNAAIWMLNGK